MSKIKAQFHPLRRRPDKVLSFQSNRILTCNLHQHLGDRLNNFHIGGHLGRRSKGRRGRGSGDHIVWSIFDSESRYSHFGSLEKGRKLRIGGVGLGLRIS